jgi:hypothetical protein
MERFQQFLNDSSPATALRVDALIKQEHVKALSKKKGVDTMRKDLDDGRVVALPIDSRKRSARRELSYAEGRKKDK